MTDIILSTLNARYIHASLGLRYLKANMGDLTERCEIVEFTINQRPESMVEVILQHNPSIVGFGVYIWNTDETRRAIGMLKAIKPELSIILGGPEVSYEFEDQAIVKLADYLITGPADLEFSRLCHQLLAGERPKSQVIEARQEPLPFIQLPYFLYNEQDLQNRVLYVEASRGCPFKCEFCLSSLDKTAWPFDLELFLAEMQKLFDRGARHFKFVDRTFNLKTENCLQILKFFLEKLKHTELFLHFELIPDRLPESLKKVLPLFPAASLQFEIGVQSFNPRVQALISRRQDNVKTRENLAWIRHNTTAHIHADLIFGLPGESLQSFARGFDALYQLNPHEIQLGILKRLRGTPIDRHNQTFDMRYKPDPPYTILSNCDVDFQLMQKITRLARYWDLIANSGRFVHTMPLMLEQRPFDSFFRLSESIYAQCGQTYQIALKKLFDYVYIAMTEELSISLEKAFQALEADYAVSGLKGWFSPPIEQDSEQNNFSNKTLLKAQSRQLRHRNKNEKKKSGSSAA